MSRSFRCRLRRAGALALPVLVALFLVMVVLAEEPPGRHDALTLLGVLAALAQGLALWWRRSRPVLVMIIALAGGLVVQVLAPTGVFPYAGLFAIASLAATRPPRVSLPALIALQALTALNFRTAPTEDAQFAMVVTVLPWALGETVRNRRAAIAEASRRAVTEEQARIARELHDVIAHSVSVIVVQAAAADDVFDERPDQARTALRSIESAGREALGELRRLLAVVRPGQDGDPSHPQPGLDRLGDLAKPLRAAGLQVDLRREGADPATAVPAGVDLSAYRIVQEALTNTLRHAGASRVQVTVRSGSETLELDVRDDGRGIPPGTSTGAPSGTPTGVPTSAGNGSGRGIAGMRERAAMLGGTLEAGPLPGGGFRVHARLPLAAAR